MKHGVLYGRAWLCETRGVIRESAVVLNTGCYTGERGYMKHGVLYGRARLYETRGVIRESAVV